VTKWRILWGAACAVIVWSACLAWRIADYGGRHDPGTADVAIVLGAAVRDTAPSPVFAARIDHAIALYHGGRVTRIVFTGGVGGGDGHAEAEVARRRAIAAGVPAASIAVETQSTITYENLVQAKALLPADQDLRVLIVSDPLHMRRSITMARDLGLNAHPAPTPMTRYRSWRTKAGFLGREVVFYSLYLLQRLPGTIG
jgi:uncharacterized SAM-binding protein YcdF (DUF218 family)